MCVWAWLVEVEVEVDDLGSEDEMETLEVQHWGQQEDTCLHLPSELNEPQREDFRAEQKDEPPVTHTDTQWKKSGGRHTETLNERTKQRGIAANTSNSNA